MTDKVEVRVGDRFDQGGGEDGCSFVVTDVGKPTHGMVLIDWDDGAKGAWQAERLHKDFRFIAPAPSPPPARPADTDIMPGDMLKLSNGVVSKVARVEQPVPPPSPPLVIPGPCGLTTRSGLPCDLIEGHKGRPCEVKPWGERRRPAGVSAAELRELASGPWRKRGGR